jgi:hypothetical protein
MMDFRKFSDDIDECWECLATLVNAEEIHTTNSVLGWVGLGLKPDFFIYLVKPET